ncbi:hypothetical protein BAE44_0001276 [Dichanthelium oligosanthes]|uniref:Uncharacterized protein n=1 Tax=Dichanthelium oligosanthes TaxID=888268 RepID=A0A1E5WKN6_9POAL|nr:hypothetical protein BAE44_0001276 [Dichanthelium oligosanthes]
MCKNNITTNKMSTCNNNKSMCNDSIMSSYKINIMSSHSNSITNNIKVMLNHSSSIRGNAMSSHHNNIRHVNKVVRNNHVSKTMRSNEQQGVAQITIAVAKI